MRLHTVLALSLSLATSGCLPFFFDHDDKDDHDFVEDTGAGQQGPDGDPTDPNQDPCEARLKECLASGLDPRACQDEFRACHAPPTDDGQPGDSGRPDTGTTSPDPLAACDQLLGECLQLGLPERYCNAQHDECVARYTPDPCEQLLDSCLDLGLDPEYCRSQYDGCAGLDPATGDGSTGEPDAGGNDPSQP